MSRAVDRDLYSDKLLDDYGALEPAISGQIMELHHSKHHNTYVTSYNTQIEKLQEAQQKGDIQAQIAIQPMINFHGGKRGEKEENEKENVKMGNHINTNDHNYRRPHQPHPLLGEPRPQVSGWWRASKRRPFKVHRLSLRLARFAQGEDERCACRHSRLRLGMAGAGHADWSYPDQDLRKPRSCRWTVPSVSEHPIPNINLLLTSFFSSVSSELTRGNTPIIFNIRTRKPTTSRTFGKLSTGAQLRRDSSRHDLRRQPNRTFKSVSLGENLAMVCRIAGA